MDPNWGKMMRMMIGETVHQSTIVTVCIQLCIWFRKTRMSRNEARQNKGGGRSEREGGKENHNNNKWTSEA